MPAIDFRSFIQNRRGLRPSSTKAFLYDSDGLPTGPIDPCNQGLIFLVVTANELAAQAAQGGDVTFQLGGQALRLLCRLGEGVLLLLDLFPNDLDLLLQSLQLLLQAVQPRGVRRSVDLGVQGGLLGIQPSTAFPDLGL